MAGSVWEWCLNEYEKADRLAPERDVRRVVRGGSWDYDRVSARCACRGVSTPGSRDSLGLRLVCVAPVA